MEMYPENNLPTSPDGDLFPDEDVYFLDNFFLSSSSFSPGLGLFLIYKNLTIFVLFTTINI